MAQTSPQAPTAPPRGPLTDLLKRGARHREISAYLDALPAAERLEQVLAVTGSAVGKLYDAVADAPQITVAEFCPPDLSESRTLIYEGRNSLPSFSRFQKRFQRRGSQVVGYNHQSMSFATGPGYFMTVDGDDFRKELLFDYTQEPAFFPEGWPAYKPNGHMLSRLVYFNMKDYCRRVAKGVIVGAAFKKGVAQNAYFTLTLPDLSPLAGAGSSSGGKTNCAEIATRGEPSRWYPASRPRSSGVQPVCRASASSAWSPASRSAKCSREASARSRPSSAPGSSSPSGACAACGN